MTVINNQVVESTCKTGIQQGFKRTRGVIQEVSDKAIDRLMSSRFAATLMPKSVLEKHTAKIAKQNLEKHLAATYRYEITLMGSYYGPSGKTECKSWIDGLTNGIAEKLEKQGLKITGGLAVDEMSSGPLTYPSLLQVEINKIKYMINKSSGKLTPNVLIQFCEKANKLKAGEITEKEFTSFCKENYIIEMPEKMEIGYDWYDYYCKAIKST